MVAELFPRSKLVFLRRDGRDVVDSWLAAHAPGSWAIGGGAFPVDPENRIPLIRWLAGVWAYRTEAVLEAYWSHCPRHRLMVRYEEMRDDSARSLRAICDVSDIDPTPAGSISDRHRFESLPATDRGPLREARLAQPGSWRENLSPHEQAAMEDVLGETLEQVGYRRDLSAAA